MSYENALKGVKKLRMYAIFAFIFLIGANVFFLVTSLADITRDTLQAFLKNTSPAVSLLLLTVLLGFIAIAILVFIWRITGITIAMRDETTFKKALIWLCVYFVCMIPCSILQRSSTAANILARVCAQAVGLLPDYYILVGLKAICGKVQATDAEALIRRDTRMYLIFRIVMVVAVPFDALIPVQYTNVLACAQTVFLIHATTIVRNLLSAKSAKS